MLHDARDYQILFLSLFLGLGIGTRDWTLHPEFIGVAIATCLLTQWGLCWLKNQRSEGGSPLSSLRSALITGLSLSLLLRADHATTIALAAFLAIASKFVFQAWEKHFFNPATFGIISVLVLTGDAWVSPGQWGNATWLTLVFAGAGGIILQRVGRWDTTVVFLAAYGGLEAIRNAYLGWSWDVYAHRLTNGSLLLFALFMITDPRSIPNARVGRWLWAIAIAGLTFVLRNQFFVSTAVFWALFSLAPLTVFLDLIWSAPRFRWWQVPEPQNPAPQDLSHVLP